MANQVPTAEHLQWSINGRAETLKTTLALHELFNDFSDVLKDEYHYEAQTLAAIAFSLWRAVFLADRTTKIEAKNKGAKDFLERLLVDNSVGFSNDRFSRDWTFLYYLDNAEFRLLGLLEDRGAKVPPRPPKGKRTARNRWDFLQSIYAGEVEWLFKVLDEEDKKRKKPSPKK